MKQPEDPTVKRSTNILRMVPAADSVQQIRMTTLRPDDTEQSNIFLTSSSTSVSEIAFEDLLKRMGKKLPFPTKQELPHQYIKVRDEVLEAVRSMGMFHTALETGRAGGTHDRAGWNYRTARDTLQLSLGRY